MKHAYITNVDAVICARKQAEYLVILHKFIWIFLLSHISSGRIHIFDTFVIEFGDIGKHFRDVRYIKAAIHDFST